MIDLKKAYREFDRYLNSFDRENEKIKLKIIHTEEVVRCAREIAGRMKLPEEDGLLAELIALLHDIGRFEQVRLYDSFEPGTMDHARFGVKLLFEERDGAAPWIRNFVEEDDWDEIIEESIARHSDYSVGKIENERILLHARLIRDADKLDNCRVKLEDLIQVLLGVDEAEAGAQSITDKVYRTCMEGRSVISKDRVTRMDYWVSYVAYFFDINFKETFEIIRENDYVNRIIDRIPYSNTDTRDKMEEIRRKVNDMILSRSF